MDDTIRIHVNQHVIKANRKNDADDPVLTVKLGRDNHYAHEVDVVVEGEVVATVVYRPEDPLSCGAVCWIETEHDVLLRER